MIHLFTGNDTKNKIKSYEKFIKTIPATMEVFFINKNNFDRDQVESFFSGNGLFFSKCVVVFTNILEKEEILEFTLKKLPSLAKSRNLFVFIEAKQNKAILTNFQKVKAEVNIFEILKEKKEKFNSFLLANALGERDKLALWIFFRRAMELGVKMEELIGVLFWKAKDMILKKNFNKFKERELQDFTSKISYLLPEARKRGLDDEAAFEQFLLEVF